MLATRDLAVVKLVSRRYSMPKRSRRCRRSRTSLAVPGSVEDAIVQVATTCVLLQGSGHRCRTALSSCGASAPRSPTTSPRRLFIDGLDGLLDIRTQLALARRRRCRSRSTGSRIDDRRQPWTASTSRARTAPTSASLLPHPVPDRQRAERPAAGSRRRSAGTTTSSTRPPTEVDRQSREAPPDEMCRTAARPGLALPRVPRPGPRTLRDMLTDPAAIELYEKDPFNPHAIARLRLCGYQKAIVMKYVDNLLDWARQPVHRSSRWSRSTRRRALRDGRGHPRPAPAPSSATAARAASSPATYARHRARSSD